MSGAGDDVVQESTRQVGAGAAASRRRRRTGAGTRILLGVLHFSASSAALACLFTGAPLVPTAAAVLLAFAVIVVRTLLFGPTLPFEIPLPGDRHESHPSTDRDHGRR